MASALQRALRLFSHIQKNIFNGFYSPFPHENFALVALNLPEFKQAQPSQKSLKELLNESILWAVPKKRKSLEKRLNKKFGWPELHYKPLVPKTNILTCSECGSHRKAGELCPTCYAKIMKETQEMQSVIEKELDISPVEKEVIVLYEDDVKSQPEFYEGKRIVEMKKKRPKLFSNNLLQKSTQGTSSKTEVAVNPVIKTQ